MTNKEVKDKDNSVFAGISDLLDGKAKIKPRSKGRVQLDLAPNPVIFIESPDFLDGPELHYPQYAVVRDFFELLCPYCNDVEEVRVKDDDRSGEILLEYGTCPRCGFSKFTQMSDFNNYNELIGVVGMRAGKSVLVACMAAAILHELICVENLQEKLGLVKNQVVDGAFVAASGEQASETIYGHFRGFYDDSPWFQNYRKRLMDLELSDPDLRRGQLYWETEKSIFFKDKHILIKALNSNSGSIAGKTRIFAVIDELSRMDAGESKRSATEVYRVLKRSLVTVKSAVERLRNNGVYTVPDARMFCISSPMFEDDKSMQLLKTAEKNNKMFSFKRTTWEFNPDITKEDLAEEFAADPIGAERDYAANPPGGENPFVQNPNIIEICIDTSRGNMFMVKEDFFEETIKGVTFKYVKPILLDFSWKNLSDYVIHCDPGHKDDSFCIAIGHLDAGLVVMDGAIECRPIPKNNRQQLEPREVYFPAMTDIITKLARKLTLKYISYDRWNSTEQIQQLRQSGILAFQKNINREDHVKFLNSMMNRSISFPRRENEIIDPSAIRNLPCSLALQELRRLEDNGVVVDHPPGGSNDMVQCYVGVHRLLTHPDDVINMREVAKDAQNSHNRYKIKSIGQVVRLPVKGCGVPRR
jgi:hypothetical protein